MNQRRYSDEEVREIFSLAATGGARDQSRPAESDGLTLDELRRIGQEAGIEPARVAQAAETIDSRGRVAPVRRSLGMPVGVSRVVDLPRAPTDREWEQLISEFRTWRWRRSGPTSFVCPVGLARASDRCRRLPSMQ
jgi:hypothetical protein